MFRAAFDTDPVAIPITRLPIIAVVGTIAGLLAVRPPAALHACRSSTPSEPADIHNTRTTPDTLTPATVTSNLQEHQPAARTGQFHLGRRKRVAVLTGHVLASGGWFGITVTVAFFGYAAAATDDPAPRDPLHTAMRAAIPLSIPAGFLTAATGIVLALGTRWGLSRD